MTQERKKIIIYIAIAVVLLLLLKKLLFSSTAENDLVKLKDKGILPSYNDSNYVQLADELETDLAGQLTTNEDGVKSIYDKMANDADIIKLNTAFGTRTQGIFKAIPLISMAYPKIRYPGLWPTI